MGGSATSEERAEFRKSHEATAWRILEQNPKELFNIIEVIVSLPVRSRIIRANRFLSNSLPARQHATFKERHFVVNKYYKVVSLLPEQNSADSKLLSKGIVI